MDEGQRVDLVSPSGTSCSHSARRIFYVHIRSVPGNGGVSTNPSHQDSGTAPSSQHWASYIAREEKALLSWSVHSTQGG